MYDLLMLSMLHQLMVKIRVWHWGVKLPAGKELVGRRHAVIGIIQKIPGIVVMWANRIKHYLSLVLYIMLAVR